MGACRVVNEGLVTSEWGGRGVAARGGGMHGARGKSARRQGVRGAAVTCTWAGCGSMGQGWGWRLLDVRARRSKG